MIFKPEHRQHLLSSERKRELPPEQIVAAAEVFPGARAVDYGCGNGFLTLDLARAVLPGGRVYAVDIQKEMLDDLVKRIPDELKEAVHLLLLSSNRLPFKDSGMDFFFMVNVLHEVKDKDWLLKEAARVTRTGGRIAVVEWKKEAKEKGPPQNERISAEELEEMLKKFGFQPVKMVEFKHHYLYLGERVGS